MSQSKSWNHEVVKKKYDLIWFYKFKEGAITNLFFNKFVEFFNFIKIYSYLCNFYIDLCS